MKNIAEEFIERLVDNIEYIDVVECAEDNDVDADELMKVIESARIKVYWL